MSTLKVAFFVFSLLTLWNLNQKVIAVEGPSPETSPDLGIENYLHT